MAWPQLDYSKHCSLHRMAYATNLGLQGWGSDWVPYTERGGYGDDIDKILATPDKCGGGCSLARMVQDEIRNARLNPVPVDKPDGILPPA